MNLTFFSCTVAPSTTLQLYIYKGHFLRSASHLSQCSFFKRGDIKWSHLNHIWPFLHQVFWKQRSIEWLSAPSQDFLRYKVIECALPLQREQLWNTLLCETVCVTDLSSLTLLTSSVSLSLLWQTSDSHIQSSARISFHSAPGAGGWTRREPYQHSRMPFKVVVYSGCRSLWRLYNRLFDLPDEVSSNKHMATKT